MPTTVKKTITNRKRKTAHKKTEEITRNARKNFEKDNYFIKKAFQTPFTDNIQAKLKSKNKNVKPKLEKED